jgi:AraC-like DNA-binding protein
MMTPGSLLLGSPGQCFECSHEHAVGDRCLSFRFTPEYFDTVSGMTEACGDKPTFGSLRLPPLRTLSSVVADACAALAGLNDRGWQELGIRLAAGALQADRDPDSDLRAISAATLARLTRSVRMIEACPDAELTVVDLAREARLSPFHFVRVFERVTGATPHQFVSRARLRAAATRLRTSGARIVDIAFDAGFNDLSTFNRAFRSEFGVSPRVYRRNRGDMPSASIRRSGAL